MIELRRHAQIGTPTCAVGRQLSSARCLVKGRPERSGFFSVVDMIDRSLKKPFEAGFESGSITVNDFVISLDHNTATEPFGTGGGPMMSRITNLSLRPVRQLGRGTFGTVYEFGSADGIAAAVKFRWVLDDDAEDLAQSAFDLRPFEQAEHDRIVAIQQSIGCNIVLSIHFASAAERVGGVGVRLDVVVMELSPQTAYVFINTYVVTNPSMWYRTEVAVGLIKQMCFLFGCCMTYRTVFPDMKLDNIGISCDPFALRLLLIDVDGLFTLRSGDPFHRRLDRSHAGIVPVATYAPYELAIDARPPSAYNEEQMVLLSLYAFVLTLIHTITTCIGVSTHIDPTTLRERLASEGYTTMIQPVLVEAAIILDDRTQDENAVIIRSLLAELDIVLIHLVISGQLLSPDTSSPDDVYIYAKRCADAFAQMVEGTEPTTQTITSHT